ncbi:ABC transporter permease [Hahella sp. HN01]|uniref:ABC transporter permease n=1 Tax=Hahella sp. HN01 TaxID=2847262 RepID=UPI001C1EF186|nr:ABC transporter permease [Hahella sp. HN01]MBU6952021.1 ABC transporter permease [Hahella sp. HN01]
MRAMDLARFNFQVMVGHRFRTIMLMIALIIGVAAVNLLTGLGEGARLFVLGEFSFLGKNTLIIMPGKKETTGGMPPITGEAPRDLTLEDMRALTRLSAINRTAPLIAGMAELSYQSRLRESFVVGTTHDFFAIRKLSLLQGRALPPGDPTFADAVCVLGQTLKRELFGPEPALGQWVRAGDRRFRVIGILEGKGVAMGLNFDEAMLIPVASAQMLFNQEGLFRVFAEVRSERELTPTRNAILSIIKERHDGEEDITLITQDALLSSFDEILRTLTLAVGGIAGISLAVAGVLIMNVMLISVSQRTAEIGLLKALGASAATVRRLFLSEALLLAIIGSLIGLLISESLLAAGRLLYNQIPLGSPVWVKVAAVGVAIVTALLFAYLPARKAAALAPVEALTHKQGP